jgi:hypothetical protein
MAKISIGATAADRSESMGMVLFSGSDQQFHEGVNRSLKFEQSVAMSRV